METIEQRRTQCLPARDNLARIEWAEGPDFVGTPVRLIDISSEGAGFVAELPPRRGQALWLRLEVPSLTEWVSVRVVWLDATNRGGLSFSGSCPHDLIASLT